MRKPILRYDGDMTRNWTSYNFQTLRDDVFMMARDGSVTGNRISPARSSCAVLVSSYNADRDVIYTQQQPVSARGLLGRGLQHYGAAYGPHHRDQALHRLPYLE